MTKDDVRMPTRRGFLATLFGAVAAIASGGLADKPKIVDGKAFVPSFEMASIPSVTLDDLRARRFYIVERAQVAAMRDIMAEEDAAFLKALA